MVVFLAAFPAGLAGRFAFDAGLQPVGSGGTRDWTGSNLDMEVLKTAAFPGARPRTAVVRTFMDLNHFPLHHLLSDGWIHLGRTTRAGLESLRTDGAWGGADLDRASAGDQDEDRDGERQAGVHDGAI